MGQDQVMVKLTHILTNGKFTGIVDIDLTEEEWLLTQEFIDWMRTCVWGNFEVVMSHSKDNRTGEFHKVLDRVASYRKRFDKCPSNI